MSLFFSLCPFHFLRGKQFKEQFPSSHVGQSFLFNLQIPIEPLVLPRRCARHIEIWGLLAELLLCPNNALMDGCRTESSLTSVLTSLVMDSDSWVFPDLQQRMAKASGTFTFSRGMTLEQYQHSQRSPCL